MASRTRRSSRRRRTATRRRSRRRRRLPVPTGPSPRCWYPRRPATDRADCRRMRIDLRYELPENAGRPGACVTCGSRRPVSSSEGKQRRRPCAGANADDRRPCGCCEVRLDASPGRVRPPCSGDGGRSGNLQQVRHDDLHQPDQTTQHGETGAQRREQQPHCASSAGCRRAGDRPPEFPVRLWQGPSSVGLQPGAEQHLLERGHRIDPLGRHDDRATDEAAHADDERLRFAVRGIEQDLLDDAVRPVAAPELEALTACEPVDAYRARATETA
jgi:hypothetical protein